MKTPLNAVVIDDELPAREELCFLLGQIEDVELVGQTDNGVDALQIIEDAEPHVAFLDIQMPGLTGFELARLILDRKIPVHVVFVTAFDQYAIDAFDVNAVDYLLKPVEQGRLGQAVERVRHRVDTGEPLDDRLQRLLRTVTGRSQRPSQVVIKVAERLLPVQADDIISASVEGDIIHVVTGQLSGTVNFRTLDELQARLDPEVFWRVHRSHLVNINKIKEIVPWFSRNYILRMKDAKGSEIPVSRAHTRRLRDYLKL
ncbi:MAG: LytTR family DNA-binding domain-containing protein [Acidobacteriota bacterium]